jgi:cytochrome P450
MPTLWLADAEGIKTVAGEATVFQKDIETVRIHFHLSPFFVQHLPPQTQYKTVNIYGENLVGTEGAEWRRHRRVAKPAFNEVRARRFLVRYFESFSGMQRVRLDGHHPHRQ